MTRYQNKRVVATGAVVLALGLAGAGCSSGAPAPGAPVQRLSAPAAASAPRVPAYRLSAPASAGGFPFHQASSASQQKMAAAEQQSAQQLGISGTPVEALYDDAAEGEWVVFIGINNTGGTPFDPSRLHARLWQQPATHDDGTGDRVTTSWSDADPGPHGGRGICSQTLDQSGTLAAEDSACLWMTAATFGEVTFYPQGFNDRQLRGFSTTDAVNLMVSVRADVEQPL
ncbi:hypothetical protein [Kitasatospora mediocidica]|uniref:hypothetical protein n=1 Tax=Kitasatospora mediocidica TaxID=58352 RepID=UPI00055F508B|nr:hypothetical protein [Kitasatospora mediocidica]